MRPTEVEIDKVYLLKTANVWAAGTSALVRVLGKEGNRFRVISGQRNESLKLARELDGVWGSQEDAQAHHATELKRHDQAVHVRSVLTGAGLSISSTLTSRGYEFKLGSSMPLEVGVELAEAWKLYRHSKQEQS